jgi:hypothetical protein
MTNSHTFDKLPPYVTGRESSKNNEHEDGLR